MTPSIRVRMTMNPKIHPAYLKVNIESVSGSILIDDQSAPSLTAAIINHFKSVQIKKKKDDEAEGQEEQVSVHHQCLVTKSCYHQDRDINKRINTAAKLRPKADGRILQMSEEVLAKLKEEKDQHKTGSSKKKSKQKVIRFRLNIKPVNIFLNISSKKQNQ